MGRSLLFSLCCFTRCGGGAFFTRGLGVAHGGAVLHLTKPQVRDRAVMAAQGGGGLHWRELYARDRAVMAAQVGGGLHWRELYARAHARIYIIGITLF